MPTVQFVEDGGVTKVLFAGTGPQKKVAMHSNCCCDLCGVATEGCADTYRYYRIQDIDSFHSDLNLPLTGSDCLQCGTVLYNPWKGDLIGPQIAECVYHTQPMASQNLTLGIAPGRAHMNYADIRPVYGAPPDQCGLIFSVYCFGVGIPSNQALIWRGYKPWSGSGAMPPEGTYTYMEGCATQPSSVVIEPQPGKLEYCTPIAPIQEIVNISGNPTGTCANRVRGPIYQTFNPYPFPADLYAVSLEVDDDVVVDGTAHGWQQPCVAGHTLTNELLKLNVPVGNQLELQAEDHYGVYSYVTGTIEWRPHSSVNQDPIFVDYKMEYVGEDLKDPYGRCMKLTAFGGPGDVSGATVVTIANPGDCPLC